MPLLYNTKYPKNKTTAVIITAKINLKMLYFPNDSETLLQTFSLVIVFNGLKINPKKALIKRIIPLLFHC